jgi:hypothetical protein
MTNKFILKGICALVLAVSLPSWSAEICPAEITTTQAASDIPSGYGVAEDGYGPHRLQRVGVYHGLVKDMGELVPDIQKKTASTWTFGKQSKSQINEVACQYLQTRVVLTKALPVETKSCTAVYDSPAFDQIKSFKCQ